MSKILHHWYFARLALLGGLTFDLRLRLGSGILFLISCHCAEVLIGVTSL